MGELMYPCAVLLAVGQISGPTQTGIATRCVSVEEQGTLQAANGSLDVIGKMASAGLVAVLFKPVVNIGQPGAIWWIGSGTLLGGIWIAFNLKRCLPPTFQDACYLGEEDFEELSFEDSEDVSSE